MERCLSDGADRVVNCFSTLSHKHPFHYLDWWSGFTSVPQNEGFTYLFVKKPFWKVHKGFPSQTFQNGHSNLSKVDSFLQNYCNTFIVLRHLRHCLLTSRFICFLLINK